MKKLLFAAYDMNVGGIETSLLTLLNYLADKKYDITLVLEKKRGAFLRDLDGNIKIIEYAPNNSKFFPYRKIVNLFKRIKFIYMHKNRYDFAASFATYSRMASFAARTASKNNALWGHADYLELFHNDVEKMKKFFHSINYEKFQKVVFVSKVACNSFIRAFPGNLAKVYFCNNLIDYKKIEYLKDQEINDIKKTKYTFVNVGRHDELQKKLTRIIEAAKKLKQDNLDFDIWFIGEGKDTDEYKEQVKLNQLDDRIKFLGVKKNPYPYMNLADSVILTSDYEGYPVVFLEAFTLNKPIITTDISDAMEQVEGKFGKVTTKDVEKIYETMKDFIQNGYKINEKFNPKEYNEQIIKKIENIINER